MLYPVTLFPELEHTFKHALTHEVAYASLLPERRRTLHGQVVRPSNASIPERLDEHVERLAHHALRAESWEQAAHYSRQAGRRPPAVGVPGGGPAFDQALGALGRLPREQETWNTPSTSGSIFGAPCSRSASSGRFTTI